MSVLLTDAPSRGQLIVSPAGKRTRTLLVETWKKILRLQREVGAEGFKAAFTCPACGDPIRMTVPSKTDPRLECGCTTWVGR